MSNFYAEWIDSSLFVVEEALGMAVEYGYADDVAKLEMAHDAIASLANSESTFNLTAKGQAYLQRQRSLLRGREAKKKYDRAYGMVRAGEPAYIQMEVSDWPSVDAAHTSYKEAIRPDRMLLLWEKHQRRQARRGRDE